MAYKTLRDLKQEIDRMVEENPAVLDLELAIPCESRFSKCGGTPTIAVKDLFRGFDWDNGVIFINPEKRITCDYEEMIRGQRILENLCLVMKIDYKKKPDDYVLKSVNAYITSYIEKPK
jgi:hypothetical protein